MRRYQVIGEMQGNEDVVGWECSKGQSANLVNPCCDLTRNKGLAA